MNVSASDQDDDTTSNPYSKPPGEPNRPNSGGYSLVDKLIKDGKWTKQQYQGVMDRVHEMAKNELNISLSYREQSEKRKFKICKQMAKEYPILQHYPDIWPRPIWRAECDEDMNRQTSTSQQYIMSEYTNEHVPARSRAGPNGRSDRYWKFTFQSLAIITRNCTSACLVGFDLKFYINLWRKQGGNTFLVGWSPQSWTRICPLWSMTSPITRKQMGCRSHQTEKQNDWTKRSNKGGLYRFWRNKASRSQDVAIRLNLESQIIFARPARNFFIPSRSECDLGSYLWTRVRRHTHPTNCTASLFRCPLKRENKNEPDDAELSPAAKTRVIHFEDDMYQQLRAKISDLEEEIKKLRDKTIRQKEFYDQLSQGILKTLEKTALENLQKNLIEFTVIPLKEHAPAETRASDAERKLEESCKELDALKSERYEVTDFASLRDYLEDRFNKMHISAG
ncbi:hypothetical protein IW261DRAFT_1412975 [Armillaria novae-zelandiae]|uniref:Uncharacterized protein n=1 Tax=Armillaria novae-zelandiae TaxID=153914 RepID=A0AA39PTV3_9AGAR|nr:hypothetical protein IW261DRAFT_1412975 [Armillaria novae-zelandiae]